MVIHDLRAPMMLAATVIETAANPLELLQALQDRSKAVMMSYSVSLQPHTHHHAFVWFDPGSGEFGSAGSPDAQEAWALAQAQYLRATHPTGSTTQ